MDSKEAFENAIDDWKANDEWRFADKEAGWKWFFDAALAWAKEGQEPRAWEWRITYHNGGYTAYLCTDKIEAEGYNDSMKCYVDIQPLYLHPAPQSTIPDGWKLVPIEPTEGMVNAGERDYQNKYSDMISPTPTEFHYELGGPMGYAYHAMLAAAPEHKP